MPETVVVLSRRTQSQEVLGRFWDGLAEDLNLQIAVGCVEGDRLGGGEEGKVSMRREAEGELASPGARWG